MQSTPLIGLIGLKQSGKDTVAAHLVAEYGFTRFALADPMREVALALDPIVDVSMWEDDYDASNHGVDVTRLSTMIETFGWDYAKETFPEVRRTLQRLGTEAGRDVLGEDFWINVTDAKVMDTLPAPVVITDIRFPNEYEWIKRRGGWLIRVHRPGLKATDTHVSEAMASDTKNFPADFNAFNDSTIEDLYEYVGAIGRFVLRRALT